MTDLLIRDVDDKLVEQLKKLAKSHGRSLQAELKQLIAGAAKYSMPEMRRCAEESLARYDNTKLPDSSKLIREDRDR